MRPRSQFRQAVKRGDFVTCGLTFEISGAEGVRLIEWLGVMVVQKPLDSFRCEDDMNGERRVKIGWGNDAYKIFHAGYTLHIDSDGYVSGSGLLREGRVVALKELVSSLGDEAPQLATPKHLPRPWRERLSSWLRQLLQRSAVRSER